MKIKWPRNQSFVKFPISGRPRNESRLHDSPRRNFFLFIFCTSCLFLLNISCNKSSGVNENKAYVTVTHLAPGFSSLDVLYGGASILGGGGLTYDQTSGDSLNPYILATAGVRALQITAGADTVLQGNTAFQRGLHYSLFFYDTLKNDSLKMFILQDELQPRTDTFSLVRFINFSPGPSLNLVLTSIRDTIATGFQVFAGAKLKPSYYKFNLLHIGSYAARAYRDDVNFIPLDSLRVDSAKIYTIFLQGYADSSGEFGLKLKKIRHN